MAIQEEIYEGVAKGVQNIETKIRCVSMLGLSAKAGNVASGEFSTEKAVKEGKAHLVIVAGDASR